MIQLRDALVSPTLWNNSIGVQVFGVAAEYILAVIKPPIQKRSSFFYRQAKFGACRLNDSVYTLLFGSPRHPGSFSFFSLCRQTRTLFANFSHARVGLHYRRLCLLPSCSTGFLQLPVLASNLDNVFCPTDGDAPPRRQQFCPQVVRHDL